MAGKSGGGRKQRKHGRSRRNGQCGAYIAERRHEKSHVRRITRHLARFPGDSYAKQMLSNYRAAAGTM